ncbi:MAG: DNA methylase [Deltaproteobacteria bacterium]|nr:DNA methylase [Deltaproteobacteria bacterium]
MIEKNFDIPFIASLALKEKQVQQNYRPVIAVHKWFARRPGTLFRGLLLSEFVEKPLREAFYESNDLSGLRMADPFMGGGTPLMEANRVGCEVIGFDINPMSYWIVKEEIEYLDLKAYNESASRLRKFLEKEIGRFYRTRCGFCHSDEAHVKYFLWVKVQECTTCGKDIDLFPGYLIAEDKRHPKNVFVCHKCGALTETASRTNPGKCGRCKSPIAASGPAGRSYCECKHCHSKNRYPDHEKGPPKHRLFAIEYFCPSCKPKHQGRFFKEPDAKDLANISEAETLFHELKPRFIPAERIPKGDESSRLHKWGYNFYHEMFNPRQKLALELSCRFIDKEKDERVRNALATNLSDLLRYQNMLCRYDAMALKSLDIFSIHGYPISLIQCESNFLGVRDKDKNIGSGGWSNIIEKYSKAKEFCDSPFEFRHSAGKKVKINIKNEWIGDMGNGVPRRPRQVRISCEDAAVSDIKAQSLDAVFTDPPYYGNVQYAELMDFCYVWLRELLHKRNDAFKSLTTRNTEELTWNENMGRDIVHFTEGISSVFKKMSVALKPGSPLVFTYHHNKLNAYMPLAVASLDAGLTCSITIPCPAEMCGSIHINKAASSIIDTVFVLRKTGIAKRSTIVNNTQELTDIVRNDIRALRQAGVNESEADMRCISFGHIIRLAIWNLRSDWPKKAGTKKKLRIVEDWIAGFGDVEKIINLDTTDEKKFIVRESEGNYESRRDEIPF